MYNPFIYLVISLCSHESQTLLSSLLRVSIYLVIKYKPIMLSIKKSINQLLYLLSGSQAQSRSKIMAIPKVNLCGLGGPQLVLRWRRPWLVGLRCRRSSSGRPCSRAACRSSLRSLPTPSSGTSQPTLRWGATSDRRELAGTDFESFNVAAVTDPRSIRDFSGIFRPQGNLEF